MPLRLYEADRGPAERRTGWTELFFDLVFVVAVAQLATGLENRPTVSGAGAFIGLFVPVAWAWTNYAFVADLFDAEEGLVRLIVLVAMLGVAALAATIPAAFAGRTTGYVVAWACLRADLIAVYLWAWRGDSRLRLLAAPHAIGFGAALAIWLGSLALAAPGRYVLWACALVVDLATGLVVYLRGTDVPRHRSHMPERFGLFTLIVLGGSIIAVSAGTADSHWALDSAATAVLGFVIAVGIWWLYFADFDERVFDWALAGGSSERRRSFVYGYGHLLIFPAVAAVGVGVQLAIDRAAAPGDAGHAGPVLALALAAYLVALAVVQRAAPRGLTNSALVGRLVLAAAAVALAAFGGGLSAPVFVGLAAAGLAAEAGLEALS